MSRIKIGDGSMRIAIVDDLKTERQALKTELRLQFDRRRLHAEILEYENGETFLAAARLEPFTLVFLDIYMEGENGVETAKKLRTFDSECLLIFVTTSPDHALDGFRVRALQYLVKPYTREELNTLLDEVMERIPAPDPYLELRTLKGTLKLRLKDILYAEHFQHQVHIRTVDGQTIQVRQTFREFTESLTDARFFLCSRGTIVNLEHVGDFDGKVFLLKNGESFPVSRSLSSSARQAFADFLFHGGQRL